MTFEDMTNLIEKQGADVLKANIQRSIQPITESLEMKIEYLETNGYEDNEEIIAAVLDDTGRLIKKLRKFGAIV